MAILAYLTAPWSMRVLIERRWRLWPLMLFFTWFTVDGCYAIYWHFRNPVALELMREANFPASLSLYGICGLGWLYRGSLRQLFAECRNRFGLARTGKSQQAGQHPFRMPTASGHWTRRHGNHTLSGGARVRAERRREAMAMIGTAMVVLVALPGAVALALVLMPA